MDHKRAYCVTKTLNNVKENKENWVFMFCTILDGSGLADASGSTLCQHRLQKDWDKKAIAFWYARSNLHLFLWSLFNFLKLPLCGFPLNFGVLKSMFFNLAL